MCVSIFVTILGAVHTADIPVLEMEKYYVRVQKGSDEGNGGKACVCVDVRAADGSREVTNLSKKNWNVFDTSTFQALAPKPSSVEAKHG